MVCGRSVWVSDLFGFPIYPGRVVQARESGDTVSVWVLQEENVAVICDRDEDFFIGEGAVAERLEKVVLESSVSGTFPGISVRLATPPPPQNHDLPSHGHPR